MPPHHSGAILYQLISTGTGVLGLTLTLVAKNVIGLNPETHEYWVNKDYDTWYNRVPTEAIEKALAEVLAANLQAQDHHQNGGEKVNKHHQNGGDSTTKMGVDAPPKQGCEVTGIPRGSKAQVVPINSSYKQSIDSTTTTTNGGADWNAYFEAIEKHMKVKRVDPNHTVTGNSYKAACTLFEERIPLQFVLDGIDDTFASYTPRGRVNPYPNFAYCASRIEDRWTSQEGDDSNDVHNGIRPSSGSAEKDAGAVPFIRDKIERSRQHL